MSFSAPGTPCLEARAHKREPTAFDRADRHGFLVARVLCGEAASALFGQFISGIDDGRPRQHILFRVLTPLSVALQDAAQLCRNTGRNPEHVSSKMRQAPRSVLLLLGTRP